MNIQEIKQAISANESFTLGSLVMVRQFNEDPTTKEQTPTEWVSHWDNDHRVRIVMHQEIMDKLKLEPTKSDLALKKEVIPAKADKASYVRYVVITPRNVEATF